MALQSPGVEVTVIDESFYTPAEPGTTPLIVVATAQDKTNAAGTGVASATTAANAGNAFKVTSQKELVDLFGVPNFEKTASNTPIHGSELNEYGLLAAYSLLGVSNAAFVVRADVDLGELEGDSTTPGANPADGTWWINTGSTAWGIQEWNSAAISAGGQKFSVKVPTVLTDDEVLKIENDTDSNYGRKPKESYGSIGDYAVVFETVGTSSTFNAAKEPARIWYKSSGNTQAGVSAGQWVLVGSLEWRASTPTIVSATLTASKITAAAGNFTINGSTVTIGASDTVDDIVSTINGLSITGVTARNVSETVRIYTDGTSNSNANTITVVAGTADLDELGISAATYKGPELSQMPHTSVPQWKGTPGTDADARPTGSVWIKTTEPNSGARWRASKWDAATTSWVSYDAPIYASTNASLYYLDRSGGGLNIAADSLMVQSNSNEHSLYDSLPATATFRVWRRAIAGATTITSGEVDGTTFTAGVHNFDIEESIKNQAGLDSAVRIQFTAGGTAADATLFAAAVNAAGLTNVEAGVTDDNEITLTHKLGGDIRLVDVGLDAIASLFTPYNIDTGEGTANFYNLPAGAEDSSGQSKYLVSNWKPLAANDFEASASAPQAEPEDGQLWYNPEFSDVDIMVHNGNNWVGYVNQFATTDPNGPQVAASAPETQSDGTALVDNDLWISTADLENFPTIYRWDSAQSSGQEWVQLDKTDQTTEDGVLFADARYGSSGATGNTAATIKDLLSSNYLDPDAPDPALYPQGMLLWNLRRSGGNVKRYANNYIDTTADNVRFDSTNSPLGNAVVSEESMAAYATDRWVTQSGNQEDGSGSFGRKAQRMVVVSALKSAIDTSDQIRDEERRNFNIIAAPGYPEVMSNLVGLNIDRGLTAFVIGDTPLRLAADATTLTNWGSNANLVTDNGDDGLVTYDEYLGCFYPNGFTTDLGGSNAVVPASHMMMRTIALSDQVSFPWFAPAGTRRGGISNATAVGYIDADTGEFQTVALNEGQRDTLYDLKINPITFFNGVGLVNYGQKTRGRNASALDRINVARLVVYLRSQLNKLARPYIFEPNDKITRDEIKQSVESLLLELVGLRAIYDFAVVCDETNNTPARIDRNELYVDIAIEPVKAIEFIYIPLRVKNTGEI